MRSRSRSAFTGMRIFTPLHTSCRTKLLEYLLFGRVAAVVEVIDPELNLTPQRRQPRLVLLVLACQQA